MEMESAPCIFHKKMVAICSVDNLLVFSKKENEVKKFKISQQNNFVTKEFGRPTQYLEIELIWINEEIIGLRQSNLIQKLLSTHAMEQTKAAICLMCPSNDVHPDTKLFNDEQPGQYRSIVDSSLYIFLKTRLNKATSAGILRIYVSYSQRNYYVAAQRVLRFFLEAI